MSILHSNINLLVSILSIKLQIALTYTYNDRGNYDDESVQVESG